MAPPDDPDAHYKCTLDADSLVVARDQLHEDPEERLGHVRTLRAWILQQPHLRCRIDTEFLIWFLRGAKFSQLRARELIENYLTMLTDMSDWFLDTDTTSAGVQTYILKAVSLPLPKRDNLKRQIMMIRPGAVDTKDPHYSIENEMRAYVAVNHWCRGNETTQVHGQVLFFDFTGYTMKHMARMTAENSRKSMKVWQDCIPGRVKEFHFYNTGTLFESMMAILRPFMKKKTRDRIHSHSTLESVYRYLPPELLPNEYHPDDYKGPSIGPISQLTEQTKHEVSNPEFRDKFKKATSADFGIDKSKKDKKETQSSFRKLNID